MDARMRLQQHYVKYDCVLYLHWPSYRQFFYVCLVVEQSATWFLHWFSHYKVYNFLSNKSVNKFTKPLSLCCTFNFCYRILPAQIVMNYASNNQSNFKENLHSSQPRIMMYLDKWRFLESSHENYSIFVSGNI